MGITHRFRHWTLAHESYLLLAARIVLGLILLVKGIYFISHSQVLQEMIQESRFAQGTSFWVGYILFAHFFGGVFIILGLFTRIAALLQIPVLLGAIFFVIPRQTVVESGQEFVLSFIVLALLILVLIKGGGKISMDAYKRTHQL